VSPADGRPPQRAPMTRQRALEDYTAALRAVLAIPGSAGANGSHVHGQESPADTTTEEETPS
jgi:hypothetical protein